ncbi:MAG: HEPN domain-containing protein [Candidatus Thermoplasmatota archaeon]
MQDEIKSWWMQAMADLEAAEDLATTRHYYLSSLCSHQAVEKALKALCILKHKILIKTHDIVMLAEKAGLPSDLIDACDELNPVYIETRYPDASGVVPAHEYTQEDARRDLEIAEKVIKWIEQQIS